MIIEGSMFYKEVTLSTDTSAYASGDLIADAQIVEVVTRANNVPCVLHSVAVLDEDDQGAAFTIYFVRGSASWGTENSAPNISDANARNICGWVDVETGDYKDVGGSKIAFKNNQNIGCAPVDGSDDLYVAVVNGSGTPTYTASGLKLRLFFLA